MPRCGAPGSPRLSVRAGDVLGDAEAGDGIAVSVATLVDLWYVAQNTQAVTAHEPAELRGVLIAVQGVYFQPVDVAVADDYTAISRQQLTIRGAASSSRPYRCCGCR